MTPSSPGNGAKEQRETRGDGLDAHASLEATMQASPGDFSLSVDLTVARGEVLAIVGPSGAGKSTTLAAIAGLLPLDAGSIRFEGELWFDHALRIDVPTHRRRVGFLHQDYALFPHLSVRRNVEYGAAARGEGDAAGQADRWLATLGASQLAERRTAGLSGGERQRVALARALASGAKLLLLDEPFASLDPSTRTSVRRELREFLASSGMPAIFVTHDQTDALVLAGRIAVMEDGRITQLGTREDLLTRPSTAFVAELFGLNFHRATLSQGSGLREARAGDCVFHVISTEAAGAVALAFPPSAVTLSDDRPVGSAQNVFLGTIQDVHPLADRTRVVVECGVRIAADVALEAASSVRLAQGHEVWASVKATAIQVYP